MTSVKYVHWVDGEYCLGYLADYPDYITQGLSKDELVEHLKDLLSDLTSGEIPFVRQVDELVIAE